MLYHNIQITNEQKNVLDLMLNSPFNLFIQGKAGTGKTVLINIFAEQCQLLNINLVCLAPTGFAAQNLPGGMTLHNFFKLPIGFFDLNGCALSIGQEMALQAVDVILIDECSMLRSDYFYGIDYILRQVNNSNQPFAGKKIILAGDIFQLPPVIDDPLIERHLEAEFGGIYFFNTLPFMLGDFRSVILHQVYRQSDPFFLELLDAIRFNTPNVEAALNFCNQRLVRQASSLDDQHICCTRNDAAAINAEALSTIDGDAFIVDGKICGRFPENDLPTSQRLVLKIGSRVTLLTNQISGDSFRYTNGSIGTVVDFKPEPISLAVLLDSGIVVRVNKNLWSNFEYDLIDYIDGQSQLIQDEIGTFTQIPVQLAYASTIHKAQGKTLPRARMVLGGRGCFAPGQLYTGISRVRNLEDLTLDRPVQLSEILVDPQILDFYECLKRGV